VLVPPLPRPTKKDQESISQNLSFSLKKTPEKNFLTPTRSQTVETKKNNNNSFLPIV